MYYALYGYNSAKMKSLAFILLANTTLLLQSGVNNLRCGFLPKVDSRLVSKHAYNGFLCR